jgi:hypothetical protein
MRFGRRIAAASILAALLAFWPVAVLCADSVEGRWILVEQHYGKGRSDLAPAEQPVKLRFAREGGELVGRIWVGDDESKAVGWPAMAVRGEPVPARVRARSDSSQLDRVRVEYSVEPSPGDGLVLEIVEEYRLVDDGRALEGSVRVAFVRGGEPRGSYVLHRRFEREP